MGPWGWLMAPYVMSSFGYPYGYGYRRYVYSPPVPYLPFVPYAYSYGAPIAPTKEEELKMLEDHSRLMEQELTDLRKRIAELKK